MIIMSNLLFMFLLPIAFCQTIENPLMEIPLYLGLDAYYDCPVPELKDVCVERCGTALLECILDCNEDGACLSNCIRVEIECIDDCPCEYNCLEGCTGCANPVCLCEAKETNADWNTCLEENSVLNGRCLYACQGNTTCNAACNEEFWTRQLECPCEENCIGGCPCQNYSCAETTPSPDVTTPSQPETTTSPNVNAVLVLGTTNGNKPMIVDFNGNINDDLNFEYADGATAASGCGTTLMGEFWYFGSGKKVSKINGCRLERQADMSFDFTEGACNTFLQPDPRVVLCFDRTETTVCHTFDGEYYHSVESSKYSHYYTLGLGNYKNQALTTGCYNKGDCNVKTELLNMETLTWSDGPDFPFTSSYISFYSTTQTADAAYVIGGYWNTGTTNVIAEYRNDQWSQLDDLNTGRYGHGSITIGRQTMIIGGYGDSSSLETEVWELENGNNKIIQPILAQGTYQYGIGLYAVDFDFCKKSTIN